MNMPVNRTSQVSTEVKKLFSSASFLAAIIFYSLAQVAVLLTLNNNGIFETILSLTRFIGIDSSTLALISKSVDLINSAQYLSPALGVITAIGLWLLYANARNCAKTGLRTSSLTIIWITNLIQFICVCISLLFLLGISFLLIYMLGELTDYNQIPHQIMFWVVVAIVAVSSVLVLFYVKVLSTISIVKNTVASHEPDPDVSILVAIACFLSAIVLILTFDFSIQVFGRLFLACSALLFGIHILKYRSTMGRLSTTDD